jgi:type II restriction/modification system DNA methylase subunit YeeA
MDSSKLKRFAQHARRLLLDQVKAKLDLVLAQDSAARRENASAVKELEEQISQTGKAKVIDKVAYTWFNRFCALRFMDLNGYSKIRVVSPADESQFLPEVLAEAKQGHMDEDRVPEKTRQRVDALLSGKAPSHDPQQEAYRLLVVAECNAFHQAMPYLFERIADYTELLMPDDLLSGNSVLAYTREAMTPDACQDVEVIGWLYQFYISEKKDQVFDGLKKNQKITPENIPAATQLFTPHWIVRYLVENSLGRLWMLNHPGSPLAGQMDYYIAPESPETDFLKIAKPEDIKVCDPACGSGHMLTYAFDLLYAIYEEVGTDPSEIPEKILTHNLFGIEIDERAGELAAFALTMKARAKNRRFFNKGIKPNICVLQKVTFDADELSEYMDAVGRDLFTLDLRETLQQFAEVDNLGSLITPKLASVANVLPVLKAQDLAGNLFLSNTHTKVMQLLQMVECLSTNYQVAIANPPYMHQKGMNVALKAFLNKEYPTGKTDLFSAFMLRILSFGNKGAYYGFVTPFSWMFLSTFESFRSDLLKLANIQNLVQLEFNAFEPAMVSVCAFTLKTPAEPNQIGSYIRLVDFKGPKNQAPRTLEAIHDKTVPWYFKFKSDDFSRIPGSAISYWLTEEAINAFSRGSLLQNFASPKQGLATTDNSRFIRFWYEVNISNIHFDCQSRKAAQEGGRRWFPYNKGGDYRRWYGNNEYVVNWENDGKEIKENVIRKYPYLNGNPDFVTKNQDSYFQECITWTRISAAYFGVRYSPPGFIYDVAGSSAFPPADDFYSVLAFMSSAVADFYIKAINPTMTTQSGSVGKLPYLRKEIDRSNEDFRKISQTLIEISKKDWDDYERSWHFAAHPLVTGKDIKSITIHESYKQTLSLRNSLISSAQELENKNGLAFVNAYSLGSVIRPYYPREEITLTCNPHYRYGSGKSEDELLALMLADTIRELVSYAVGCMFGRYALDNPGLVLANQNETIEDYRRLVPNSRFEADADNVIPILDSEWFADDVTERFRQFLRVTFGDSNYEENLAFIEKALNVKTKRNYTLRDYFLGEFYSDHIKAYKKRPIYWLFSSPKGTFNALIYLHRYRPDTASVVLRYLRDFRAKLAARLSTLERVLINPATSQGEKTRANKEIDTLKKQIIELQDYENDTLYPLATAQVAIDLDDGVKVNYLKLGAALKKIPALDAKEED